MFNSLVVIIEGVKYVYECHSHSKAMEILASQYAITPKIDSFQLIQVTSLAPIFRDRDGTGYLARTTGNKETRK